MFTYDNYKVRSYVYAVDAVNGIIHAFISSESIYISSESIVWNLNNSESNNYLFY